MPKLPEPTIENVGQMIAALELLCDAPVPEVAVIANTVSGMLAGQDLDLLLTLADGAAALSGQCLERQLPKMVLCGNVAPEGN